MVCPECGGTGAIIHDAYLDGKRLPFDSAGECPACHGTGEVPEVPEEKEEERDGRS
jgi:DnaJ-class molecular chaperone